MPIVELCTSPVWIGTRDQKRRAEKAAREAERRAAEQRMDDREARSTS